MPYWLFYLLGPLALVSPLAACLGAIAAIFVRSTSPLAWRLPVYVLLAWGGTGGVAYLFWSARFWRLHAAGIKTDYIFDTAGMRVSTLTSGAIAIVVSLVGTALVRRRSTQGERPEPSSH